MTSEPQDPQIFLQLQLTTFSLVIGGRWWTWVQICFSRHFLVQPIHRVKLHVFLCWGESKWTRLCVSGVLVELGSAALADQALGKILI